MSDEVEHGEPERARRKALELIEWSRFWWKKWLHDPAIRRLTPEQRGRLMDVRAATYSTPTPGVMEEEDVRAWAGYTPKEWVEVREVFARPFVKRRRKGLSVWILEDIVEDWEATLVAMKIKRVRAMKGVAARRRRKDLATTGSTPGATSGSTPGATPGAPRVQPRVEQIGDVEIGELRGEKTGKTESEPRTDRAKSARSRVGSAGSAGSPSSSPLPGIIARATEGNGGSQGRGA